MCSKALWLHKERLPSIEHGLLRICDTKVALPAQGGSRFRKRNTMSGGNWKEMFNAACEGDLDLLDYHVKTGADVNYAHPEFLATPLVASILSKQEPAALYLLDHGANPNLLSEFDGLTPIQAAREAGLIAVERRLRCLGAVATSLPAPSRTWGPGLFDRVQAPAAHKGSSASVNRAHAAPQSQGGVDPPPEAMLAWVCRGYGGPEVLALEQQPVPRPSRHQLLVRVDAATVETSDVRIRSRQVPRGFGFIFRMMFGWRRPRQPVLGSVLAGTVVAVGPGIRRWAVGQRVVAATGMAAGAHAQWALLSEKHAIVPCPAALTMPQAVALVFGGLTAQWFLDRAALQPHERVLVIGATGSVGSALVQMACARGAEVTALSSAANLGLARELGAAVALDYRQHPPPSLRAQDFDVVADTCAAASFVACLPLLRAHGRYLNIAGDLLSMLTRPRRGRRSIDGTSREQTSDLQRVLNLATEGRLKPVIDSVWHFTALPAAHARAGSGLKCGCVVVQVASDQAAVLADGQAVAALAGDAHGHQHHSNRQSWGGTLRPLP